MKTKKANPRPGIGYQPPTPRIYQIPATLVDGVDRAAATGGEMGVFVSSMFSHMVSEARGLPQVDKSVAHELCLFTIGVIAGIGMSSAISSVFRLNSVPQDAADILLAVGLSEKANEAGTVLATAIRYFVANLDVAPQKQKEYIKKFISDVLANKSLA